MTGTTMTAAQPSRARRVLSLGTLFALGVVLMGENAVLPITYDIYGQFGDGFVANYIVSAAALWMALGAMLSTRLMATMTKKRILVLGAALFAVSASFCAAIVNPLYVAAMRSLMGLGEGIINTVAMAYIAQAYIDEASRAKMTGYFNACATVLGAALSLGAGILSTTGWTTIFRLFLPMLVIAVCAALFIPELGMETSDEQACSDTLDRREGLGSLYVAFIVDYLIFVTVYATIAYFVSVLVVEVGVGDGSFAGTVLSISTVAGFFSAAAFGQIYAKLRKRVALVGLAASVASALLLFLFPTRVIIMLSCAIIGFMYGAYFSYSYTYVGDLVPASRVNDAIGYTTALYTLMFFFVPFAISSLMGLTGGLVRPLFLGAAVLGVIGVAIELATDGAFNRLQESRMREMEEE